MDIHIIYTKSRMLISKKSDLSWREIQDEYVDYIASLGPWSAKDVADYLVEEYPNLSPTGAEQVSKLIYGSEEYLEL